MRGIKHTNGKRSIIGHGGGLLEEIPTYQITNSEAGRGSFIFVVILDAPYL